MFLSDTCGVLNNRCNLVAAHDEGENAKDRRFDKNYLRENTRSNRNNYSNEKSHQKVGKKSHREADERPKRKITWGLWYLQYGGNK